MIIQWKSYSEKCYLLNREWKTIMIENGTQSKCENVNECDHTITVKSYSKKVYQLNRELKTIITENGSQSKSENVNECDHTMNIIF